MAIQKISCDVTCKFMGTRPGKLDAEFNTETGELTGECSIKMLKWFHYPLVNGTVVTEEAAGSYAMYNYVAGSKHAYADLQGQMGNGALHADIWENPGGELIGGVTIGKNGKQLITWEGKGELVQG